MRKHCPIIFHVGIFLSAHLTSSEAHAAGVFRLGFLESVLAHTVVSGLINAICCSVIVAQAPLLCTLRGGREGEC